MTTNTIIALANTKVINLDNKTGGSILFDNLLISPSSFDFRKKQGQFAREKLLSLLSVQSGPHHYVIANKM